MPPNTVTVCAKAMDKHKQRLGKTDSQLAAEGDFHPRAFTRVRNGESIEVETAHAMAKALGITFDTLIDNLDPPALPEPEEPGLQEVTIRLDIPRREMLDQERQADIKELLRRVTGIVNEIEIRDVTNGKNTALVLRMTDYDILRLLAALLDGTLARLKVTAIRMSEYGWLMRTLMWVAQDGKPRWLSDEAWNEIMEDSPFKWLAMKSSDCLFCKGV